MSAPKQPTPKHGSGHRHPPELRERAVRMVEETIKQTGERHGVVTRVAVQLGLGSETLRHWVKQAEIDNGQRPGVTTKDQLRIAELEKESMRRSHSLTQRTRCSSIRPGLDTAHAAHLQHRPVHGSSSSRDVH
jgi:transposase